MIRSITITDWISQQQELPLADVRTPAEFNHGHVPGAFNLPLFSNEERVRVGTTYKQRSREEAILLGFDLAGPKWSGFIRQCLEQVPGKRLAVHCWRGGMRSGAMAWALDLYGFEVYQVKGGYKEYRRWAHRRFEQRRILHVLGGMTGSGKTRLLQYMRSAGDQVIDLEELAQHQGSAYGSMNRLLQPSQEQFENNLAWQLKDMETALPLWVEDESMMIGKCKIPMPLWQQMRSAPMIDLQCPTGRRIDALVQEYGVLDKDFLAECTARIGRRLGPEQTRQALAALREDRMDDFIRLVLVYYDKSYRKGLSMRDAARVHALQATGHDMPADREALLQLAATLTTAPP